MHTASECLSNTIVAHGFNTSSVPATQKGNTASICLMTYAVPKINVKIQTLVDCND